MLVVVIVLAVVAAVALAVALVAAHRARVAAHERAAATEAADHARHDADARVAAAEAARRDAEAARDAAALARAEALERAATAGERASAVGEEGRRLAARLDEAAGERDALRATLTDAQAGGNDPATLWALEVVRAERRWREAVAHTIDAPSPFAEGGDARAVVEVEVAAVHEETGTTLRLDWQLPAGLTASASLAAVRAAQEVLAAGAKAAEVATLSVSASGDDLLVVLAGVDEHGRTAPLAPPPLPAGSSVQLTSGPGTVTARVAGALRT
jgi:colicin import membrane protein